MKPSNSKDAAGRRAVAERARRFFAELTAQLAGGSAEIWSRVERRLSSKPREETDDAAPPVFPSSSSRQQQQLQQQQQSKSKPDAGS